MIQLPADDGAPPFVVQLSVHYEPPRFVMTSKYAKVGHVAAVLNCEDHNVRWWCEQFGVHPKRRNNIRLFTRRNIDVLFFGAHLIRVLGFTTAGARRIVDEWRANR